MRQALYLKKIMAVLIITFVLCLSVVSFEGALLCFGKDGHVAIEFVDACGGSDFGSRFAKAEVDACGPCEDVQFQSSPGYSSRAFHFTEAHTQTLFSTAEGAPPLPIQAQLCSLTSLPHKPPYKILAGLRTVVLQI